jgi:hypothetical protein
MFKPFSIKILIILFLGINISSQEVSKTAVELEEKNVTANRKLILWMQNPKKHPRETADEIYTCPEETRGSYYSGIARVSLIDIETDKFINSVTIQGSFNTENNFLDLPYWIHRGYYEVPTIDKNGEGKPILMNLKDYNNDGKPYEFALFDAVACMGLPTTLIGYSEKQDKVIQYQTELKTDKETTKEYWVDYLFGRKPDKQGVYKYEVDYRGRGGALDKYEIRYDKEKEMFYGTLISITDEENK